MKTVLLMRHAEAAPSEGADFERALTQAGHRMAREVGLGITRLGMWPDMILCSAALRTRQTCENMLDIWRQDITPHVMYDPAIYRAEADNIIELLTEQDTEHKAVMLIGHNPTIHLATLFLCGPEEAKKKPGMVTSFPPSSCAVLSFPVDDWIDLRKGTGQLLDYFFAGGA